MNPSNKQSPTHRLTLVTKDEDKSRRKFYDFGVMWIGSQRVSAQLGRAFKDKPGIAAIKLTDGTVIKAEDVYLNVYESRPREDAPRNDAPSHGGSYGDDSDLPF
jgi:hypothetical protein